jgi:hypothetical protein
MSRAFNFGRPGKTRHCQRKKAGREIGPTRVKEIRAGRDFEDSRGAFRGGYVQRTREGSWNFRLDGSYALFEKRGNQGLAKL